MLKNCLINWGQYNLYFYTKKEVIDQMRKIAEQEIISKGTMSSLDYYNIIYLIVNNLKDQHTAIIGSPKDIPAIKMIRWFNNIKLLFIGKEAIIASCEKKNVFMLSNKVISINGIAPYSLLTNVVLHFWTMKFGYSDDFDFSMSNTYEYFDLMDYASLFYKFYNFRSNITVIHQNNKGNILTNQIYSYSHNEFFEAYKDEKNQNVSIYQDATLTLKYGLNNYEHQIIDDVCWLRIYDFAILDNVKLSDCFAEIKKYSIKKLIIDIRDNSGGSDILWSALMGFLNDKPYKINYKNKPHTAKEWYSFALKVGEKDYYDFDWDNYFFNGKIFLLINRGTFSAAVHFADVMKYYKIATLIGEETENYASHFGGVSKGTLPNSQMMFNYSTKYFISVTGDESRNGVKPDINTSSWKPDPNKVYPKYNFSISEYEKYVLEIIKTNKN